MAVQQRQPLDELQNLRREAAQARLRSIRSQIAIALTFCSIAGSQLRSGHAEHLDALLEKLQNFIKTVAKHLDKPEYVPSHEVEKLRPELARLELRILALEERGRSDRR
jgi:hypothetical protein